MKIALTGHTRGIGAAILDSLENEGHEVLGFSRSNGYDISDPGFPLDEIEPCDVFINNAYHEYAQVDLLYRVHEMWRQSMKRIICIGSRAATSRVGRVHKYVAEKAALHEACLQLSILRDQRPMVHLVAPGYVDTDMVEGFYGSPKLKSEVVADAVMWILNQPPMVYVTQVHLHHQRLG